MPTRDNHTAWMIVRLVLGMMQMAGATATLAFLVQSGITKWSLAGAGLTTGLTATSIVLFGRTRARRL